MMHLYHPTGSTPNSSTTTAVPNIPARSPHALGHACTSCYRAKTVCDGERPCQRCKRLKREDTCMDRTARNTPAASSSHTKKEPTGHTKNSKSKANKHYDHANSNVNTSESVTPTPLNQTSTAPNPFLSQSIATSATPQLSWDNLWEISSNIDGEIWNQYPLTLGNTVAPSQQQPQGLSDSLLSPQLGTSSLLSMDSNYSNSYLPQTPTMVTSSIMPVQSNEAANPMRQSLSIEMIGTTSAPIGGIGAIMGTSSGVSGPSSMNSMGNVGNSIYSINSMVGPTLGNMNAGNMNTITLNNNLPPSSSNLPSSSIVPVANSSHVGLAGGSVPVTGLTGGSTVSVHSSTPPPNSSSSASSASTGSNSDNLPRVLTLSGDSGPTDLAVMGGLMFQNHLALNSVAIFRKQLERHESTARRLQFYFSQLSEILSCQHFHLFTKSIPVPVPLSLKAPYSKEDLLAIARADSGNPSTSTLNASSNSDSSNFVPSATVAGALPFTSVDFTWTHSPLEPLSDTLSASLAGPIAISRTRRLGPFLEKDDVWLRRKKHADSLSVLSTLEREMLTAYRHRTRAKRRARRAKAHAPSASTLTTGTSTLPHAHSRKRQRSESSNNHHLLGVNSSSVELQPSVTPASNQADAIMSPTMSNDASMHGPPGSESTTSTRKHAHLDSHHSSSDSSISDSELESDDDSSQQYLKPITIMHVATCPSFSLVEPDASTPISPDHPSTPQTCACPKVQPVEMSIQVNNEWERLFGVTQSQLREMYIKEGARAAQRFNRIDSVITAHRAKVKAILGVQNDHRYHAVIVNKWGGEIHCVVRARITYDESGTFVESVHSYMPLPDPKPPTIAQVLAAQG